MMPSSDLPLNMKGRGKSGPTSTPSKGVEDCTMANKANETMAPHH